jgi:fucose 4-O-acetylase-like acetyltransferase
VVHEASWKNNKESGSMESTQLLIDRRKNRIEYIDLLKCFAIFCVLWFHGIGAFRTNNDEWFVGTDPLHTFFTTFHMPLFFLISGFFFNSSFDLTFKDFLRKKSAALLIPHLTWSIMIALMNWGKPYTGWEWMGGVQPFSISPHIYAFFCPEPRTYFWFFKELFLTCLIVFTACKIFKKRYVAFIASMLFVLLVNFFGVVGKMQRFMMPIFWTGILLKAYYPVFSKHLNKFLIGSTIAFVACLRFYDHGYMIYHMDFSPLINFQQSLAERKIVFDFSNIGISGFRLLTAVAGCGFFFALFQRFWKKNVITSFFSRCGQLTVGVYGIQAIVLQWVMHNLLDFTNVNIWIYRFLITPMLAGFVFFVSIGAIKLIQRNTPLTFILFGSSLIERRMQYPAKNEVPNSVNDDRGTYQSA